MTEPGQASSLNFLSASVPKGNKGSVSLGAVDSVQPIDSSFSRELVLASERGASSSSRRDSSSRDAFEPNANKSSKRSEPQRSSASEQSSRNDARSEKATTKSSSSPSQSDKSAAASRVDTPAKTAADSDPEEQSVQSSEAEQVTAASTSASTDSQSESTTDAPESAATSLVLPGVPTQLAQTTDDAASVDVDVSLPVNAVSLSEKASGVQKTALPSQLVDAQQAAAKLAAATTAQEDSTPTKSLGANGIGGEQLSPAQLANRQAHRLNSPLGRSVQAASEPVVEEAVEAEAAPVAIRPTLVETTAVGSVASQLKRQQTASEQLGTGVMSSEVLNKSGIPGEESTATVTQRLQHADLAAAADTDAKLTAQQVKQEVQQENQTQARLVAQQQSLNANPLLQASVADASSQPADNMLVSLGGGIVTAPVLQRADAAISQPVNAPINMPILQDDADKAMSGNIRWMVNEGVKNAVVTVTPNGMGPISVSIGLEKDQMSVSIVAMQGSTREALDSMLPRLREQLAAQGHENVKVDISDGRPEQSDRGYGQQYSGEQQHSEQGGRAMGTQVAEEEGSTSQMNEMSVTVEPVQAQVTVGNDGKIRRSYDVYV